MRACTRARCTRACLRSAPAVPETLHPHANQDLVEALRIMLRNWRMRTKLERVSSLRARAHAGCLRLARAY
eukprot:5701898-Pyramimonas_sp.AAC.1